MKARALTDFIYSHAGENRYDRRFAMSFRRRSKKSYFVLPNEVIEKYRTREISAVDVKVFAYLLSLTMREYNGYSGVKVSQRIIALRCGFTKKTVSASVLRLYKAGLIKNVITEIKKRSLKKFKTTIYNLKPLPESGFFFCPRNIFNHSLPPKMFVIYLFMCRARSFEYGKSWNSFNDICKYLGFGKNSRSEVVALIGELVTRGLIKKTVRRFKKVFVDNIYRVIGFEKIVTKKIRHKEKRPVTGGTLFSQFSLDKSHKIIKKYTSAVIIPPFYENVNALYMQLSLGLEALF